MLFMNALPNRQTDQPTDTAYYRDARTHLKMKERKRKREIPYPKDGDRGSNTSEQGQYDVGRGCNMDGQGP